MRLAALGAALGFALAIACHHDPAPIDPVDPAEQPLPPASGTPIGFLIDDSDMHLSADQLGKLRDIDTGLQAQIDNIDKATRSATNAAASSGSNSAPQQPMGRHRRGGMGGGMGGGGMGGGGGGGAGGQGHHRGTGSGGGSAALAATTGKLTDERNEDVKAALERAFAVLDPAQQARAKKVLSDHDVDLDLDANAGKLQPMPTQPVPSALPPPRQLPAQAQAQVPGATTGPAAPPALPSPRELEQKKAGSAASTGTSDDSGDVPLEP